MSVAAESTTRHARRRCGSTAHASEPGSWRWAKRLLFYLLIR